MLVKSSEILGNNYIHHKKFHCPLLLSHHGAIQDCNYFHCLLRKFTSLLCYYQAHNWSRCPGGKTCLNNHFEGIKALFSYVNIQVTNSVGGGQNHAKFFIWGHCPPCPCRDILGYYIIISLSTLLSPLFCMTVSHFRCWGACDCYAYYH